jgi:hypothetical protein
MDTSGTHMCNGVDRDPEALVSILFLAGMAPVFGGIYWQMAA